MEELIMAQFSFAAFVEYGNSCINNTKGNTLEIQAAFKKDIKAAIAKAGYPTNKEEAEGVINEINDFDMSNTLTQVPALVSGFINDTGRPFNIPACDDKTAPATISKISVDETVNEGTNRFGNKEGQPYKSITAAHDEFKLKSNREAFKTKVE